jgi:flagellar basal-body rod protein FlgB
MNPLNLLDASSLLLRKSLDLYSANQRVIASNIANAETPGYSPARFEFENELKNALTKSNPTLSTTQTGHIPHAVSTIEQVKGSIRSEPDNTGIGDENGVSVDEEMIALSENQIRYETAAQLLKKKFSLLKYVVQDGQ